MLALTEFDAFSISITVVVISNIFMNDHAIFMIYLYFMKYGYSVTVRIDL